MLIVTQRKRIDTTMAEEVVLLVVAEG